MLFKPPGTQPIPGCKLQLPRTYLLLYCTVLFACVPCAECITHTECERQAPSGDAVDQHVAARLQSLPRGPVPQPERESAAASAHPCAELAADAHPGGHDEWLWAPCALCAHVFRRLRCRVHAAHAGVCAARGADQDGARGQGRADDGGCVSERPWAAQEAAGCARCPGARTAFAS